MRVTRTYVCSICNRELDGWDTTLEGREVVMTSKCPNGHVGTARWPIGQAPPAELSFKMGMVASEDQQGA